MSTQKDIFIIQYWALWVLYPPNMITSMLPYFSVHSFTWSSLGIISVYSSNHHIFVDFDKYWIFSMQVLEVFLCIHSQPLCSFLSLLYVPLIWCAWPSRLCAWFLYKETSNSWYLTFFSRRYSWALFSSGSSCKLVVVSVYLFLHPFKVNRCASVAHCSVNCLRFHGYHNLWWIDDF